MSDNSHAEFNTVVSRTRANDVTDFIPAETSAAAAASTAHLLAAHVPFSSATRSQKPQDRLKGCVQLLCQYIYI